MLEQSNSNLNFPKVSCKRRKHSMVHCFFLILFTFLPCSHDFPTKQPNSARLITLTPILWPPDVKSWLIWKDPDAGKDWRWEEKGTTEDEMAGWHHRLNGHGFGWTPGVGDGQGGLVCCGSWGCKELDTTEQLKWTESPLKPFSVAKTWKWPKCPST